jgi:branched-subunit amino acid ABC-type transport system permease component
VKSGSDPSTTYVIRGIALAVLGGILLGLVLLADPDPGGLWVVMVLAAVSLVAGGILLAIGVIAKGVRLGMELSGASQPRATVRDSGGEAHVPRKRPRQ